MNPEIVIMLRRWQGTIGRLLCWKLDRAGDLHGWDLTIVCWKDKGSRVHGTDGGCLRLGHIFGELPVSRVSISR